MLIDTVFCLPLLRQRVPGLPSTAGIDPPFRALLPHPHHCHEAAPWRLPHWPCWHGEIRDREGPSQGRLLTIRLSLAHLVPSLTHTMAHFFENSSTWVFFSSFMSVGTWHNYAIVTLSTTPRLSLILYLYLPIYFTLGRVRFTVVLYYCNK